MSGGIMRMLYEYVGPRTIADRSSKAPAGLAVRAPEDVRRWVHQSGQILNPWKDVTATFVIDKAGILLIADRRSEHVACAGGKPVRSAGEMTFAVRSKRIDVVSVTNQSTGYCPEPDSWSAVEEALLGAGLAAPPGFDPEFVFRRCEACAAINIVKDGRFECAVCSQDLPVTWNLIAGIANSAFECKASASA